MCLLTIKNALTGSGVGGGSSPLEISLRSASLDNLCNLVCEIKTLGDIYYLDLGGQRDHFAL